jgi:hypothetical protein
MPEDYPPFVDEAMRNILQKKCSPVWTEYGSDSTQYSTSGLEALEDWGIRLEDAVDATCHIAEVFCEEADNNLTPWSAGRFHTMRSMVLGIRRLMKDFTELHEFAYQTLPFDPVTVQQVLGALAEKEKAATEETPSGGASPLRVVSPPPDSQHIPEVEPE